MVKKCFNAEAVEKLFFFNTKPMATEKCAVLRIQVH